MDSRRRFLGCNAKRASMAIIEWHEDVWQLFNDHVDYARYEFGEKTANKWLHEMATIDKWLRQFPESYTPEPLFSRSALSRCMVMMPRISSNCCSYLVISFVIIFKTFYFYYYCRSLLAPAIAPFCIFHLAK